MTPHEHNPAELNVLVTGASGFIGSHLAPALEKLGHHVRAMTRHPENYTGVGTAIAADVSRPETLPPALDGIDVAYYLVHSLDSDDFVETDARAATAFADAAAAAGVRQIIYLGGLGASEEGLSDHLRSRREVERLLRGSGVPLTVLRAAVVIGNGGISWEITRQLVAHLPAMVTPKWVQTKTQPIALPDVIRYLVGVLDLPAARDRVFEIGGPEVLRYSDMLQRAARIQNHRPLPVFSVPLLSPGLSSRWLAFVTDVDVTTGRNLVDSMSNEVIVHDNSILDVVPGRLIGYDEAVHLALTARERADAAAGESGGESASVSAHSP